MLNGLTFFVPCSFHIEETLQLRSHIKRRALSLCLFGHESTHWLDRYNVIAKHMKLFHSLCKKSVLVVAIFIWRRVERN